MTTQSLTFNNNFGNICRICLKEDGPMSSIYEPSETEDDYQLLLAARITSIAQVQISPSDGLPFSICQSCRQQVDNFYDFRLLVEISDRTLRSCLDGTQENQLRTIDSTEDAKDLDYQEFLIENTSSDDSKDLLAVNAILVPSDSGTQVWRICSVEGGANEERTEASTAMEKDTISAIDNMKEVKTCLEQELKPLTTVQNAHEKKMLYFTPTLTTVTTNNCETSMTISDQLMPMKTPGDENDVEEDAPLPTDKYNCQLCLKSFKTLRTLKSHVKDHFHSGKERIQIHDVKKKTVMLPSTRSPNRLEEQKNESSEQENVNSLAFQSCDQIFLSAETTLLSSEETKKSSGEKDVQIRNGKKHNCDECGIEFTQKSKLRYHKSTHTNTSLICTICNKNFRNVQSYNMHLKRHTLGSRFNCRECGKSYYSNSELARHTQLHTGTRQYPCNLCDMSFFSKPELNRHCKYHNGEKTFECKVCFKSYYESGHLKVHQRVHTGEKPFSCTVCEKAFITKSKLVRHCKIHDRGRGMMDEDMNISVQYRFVK